MNPTPRTSIKVFGTVSLGTNSIRLIHVSMSTSAMYKHDTFHHIVCFNVEFDSSSAVYVQYCINQSLTF